MHTEHVLNSAWTSNEKIETRLYRYRPPTKSQMLSFETLTFDNYSLLMQRIIVMI